MEDGCRMPYNNTYIMKKSKEPMDTKTTITSRISSGIASLDELLLGLCFGDNVVFLTAKPRCITIWKTASGIRLYCNGI